ncbi:unnamed protein product [Nesidiocoris tenuis]|uniref:Uncharacterized protein n=1 Tax=Nesidiocoris tenuis TaxID=355587 RepID=A0A6H5H1Q5_9HEMI|nr:unnamed protein product [Nesidiocoris tenuis]
MGGGLGGHVADKGRKKKTWLGRRILGARRNMYRSQCHSILENIASDVSSISYDTQDESPCTSKGAPERCKGKRAGSSSSSPRTSTPTVRKTPSSSAKRSSVMPTPTPTPTSTPVTPVTLSTPAQEEITMISPPACGSASSSDAAGALSKLPIPRLPKISSVVSFANNTPLPVVKRHKHIVPKDLLGDSNNSFEQEEELLNYFRRQGDDDSKTSTLRMLLERNKDTFGTTNVKAASVCSFVSSSTTRSVSRGGSAGAATAATVRRRVSFDPPPPPPDTPKKFSFVPISPISPHSPQFVTPQTPSSLPSPLTRPSSVAADPPLSSVVFACASSSSDAPLLHNVLNNPNQMYSTGWRSQSVPACVLPDITPVPSEMTDFDMTESDSSNHLSDAQFILRLTPWTTRVTYVKYPVKLPFKSNCPFEIQSQRNATNAVNSINKLSGFFKIGRSLPVSKKTSPSFRRGSNRNSQSAE